MPVEIRELVIRATVSPKSGPVEELPETRQQPFNQEAIVQECIRQVMILLKKREER